ncbi:anoctamin-8-like isoform X2 [Bolinopsis microptera]|uniref:anoctamin-8-like isoform X2 n=1 Tax=Bolinopsis microptera TaxID=2820187 RepID=UPI00307ACB12
MDCSCCLDEGSLEAKFDLMVERFRSWIDDVEYKIKDAIEKRKKKQEEEKRLAKWQDQVHTASRAENSTVDPPTTTSERRVLDPPSPTTTSERRVLDPPSPTLSDYVFSTPTDSDQEDFESFFPTPPSPLEDSPDPGVTVLQSDTQLIGFMEQVEESAAEEESNAPFRDITDTTQFLIPTVLSEYSSDDPNQILFVPPTIPRVSASSSAASQRSIKLLEKSAVIQKLLSDSQISPVQNDLSKDVNINCSEDKVTSPDTDKSEEIRNLSEGALSTCSTCYKQPRGVRPDPNISDSLPLKDVSVQVNDQAETSGISAEKVINKCEHSYKHPDIYKRSPSAVPYITLLKNMSTTPSTTSQPDSLEQPPDNILEQSTQNILEQSTQNILQSQLSTQDMLESLSYISDSPESPAMKRRGNLLNFKRDSVEQSEDDLIKQMGSSIGLTRGDQDYTEVHSDPKLPDINTKSESPGTDHKLIDHSFTEETPSSDNSPNFAAKFIRLVRRSTSDVLENHDAKNDPSLSVDALNSRAKNGVPVIPIIECDIAFRISSKTSGEVLSWFKQQLAWAGLIVTSEVGCSQDFFIKVTADSRIFLKGAENLELLKRIHPERGDGMKPFNRNETSLFCARQSTDGFLSAAERQLILYDIVTRIRTEHPVTVGEIKFYQHESVVSGLISNSVIKQIYPLHQKSKQNVLNRVWVWNFLGTQPLNLIRHYFGDEIAIYFAWLGSYTSILVVPLIVGFSIGLFYDDDDVNSADWCFTFYAFFNVVWPTLFLEIWKRRSAALAWEWGTLGRDKETQEIQRPQFHGTLGGNPVTGEVEIQYSSIKRQIKQTVSLFVSVVCLIVVLVSMLAVFRFDDYIQYICKNNTFPDFVPSFLTKFVRYTPKILLPITVGILDVMYSKLAFFLNEWENYKHQRTYENWLVLKLILFKFVNSFLALFYIAFYLQDFDKLQETLAALLITKQIVGNCGEILGPTLISWAKVYLLKRHNSTENKAEEKLSQVETESEKPRYDSSFDDYLEMFIQMGYVILFSAAYPPAAVWAFLNNIVEIRGDAFKLVNGLQRPFISRVEDIGFWQDAFEVLSVISIVVNCSLIGIRGQVGRWFPNFTTGQQILFVIAMEHVFLTIKFIIDRAIPDIPGWVQLATAKEKYTKNRALKGLEKLMQTARLKGHVRKKVDAVRSRLVERRVEEEKGNQEQIQSYSEDNTEIKKSNSVSRYKIE